MFKVQWRNPQGRLVTASTTSTSTVRRYALQATSAAPEAHELRIEQIAVDGTTGDEVWVDATADFI
ncbi:predicted protein [Streptomyces viridochromogenes DSM 40736]|uniref:Predicted protein n=1 Tax=Streptomyces viridochromogenes (strain DSM 40736 / JCM 4977 / BCRC 1201 / Tue 494) TaxID=591159 RepID=D9X0C5_STRVT|nr:hypothetical protein [Streptomyces viridochromogenes]EFL35509.1 predicted protein [Streptomyces viridochromogenes DSM 40736]